jgi:Zn-finger protein
MAQGRYVVTKPVEESECSWCGCPLYVGDVAFEGYYGEVTCGKACARSWALAQIHETARREEGL